MVDTIWGHRLPHRAAALHFAALRGYRCENAFHVFFIANCVIRGTPPWRGLTQSLRMDLCVDAIRVCRSKPRHYK